MENNKQYNVPRAQLIIADIPYNVGNYAYASNPMWYKDGDNKNGESELANKAFFDTDKDFRIDNLFHFCSRLLKQEPKDRNDAGCMVVFCSFQQQPAVIEVARKHGFKNYIPLQWFKNYSPQVLKSNMKIVGNTEYAILLYRDKLPKFRNSNRMIFNCRPWIDDNQTPKIHPVQKPIGIIKDLILTFTDPGDVVIDPCAGSGVSLLAAEQCNRKSFGFEIKKEFVRAFNEQLAKNIQKEMDL
jgi:site-specific DNA-methyltransferase (adenine-specific)